MFEGAASNAHCDEKIMNAINKLLWGVANPYAVGVLLFALAVVMFILRRRKFGFVFLGIALLWSWVWSTSLCFKHLAVWWETSEGFPQCVESMPQADAIVDLGGGVGGDIDKAIYPDMHASADREWHSARLWKAGKAPIVIPSGRNGNIYSKPLLVDLGVPADRVICEDQSLNTEENAKFIQELLIRRHHDNSGVDSGSKPCVLLVTSAWHMKRSLLMFRKYAPEITVIPAATDYEYYIGTRTGISWRDFVPSVETYFYNTVFFHEVLGYFGYKWFRK